MGQEARPRADQAFVPILAANKKQAPEGARNSDVNLIKHL